MSRRRLGLAVVLLLTVAGLGFAATTVDTTASNGGGTAVGGVGSGDAGQTGDDERLLSLLLVGLLAAVLASTGYTLFQGDFPWQYLVIIGVCTALILLIIVAGQLLADGGERPQPVSERQVEGERAGQSPTATPFQQQRGGNTGERPSSLTLGVLFAVLFAGALAVVWFSTGREPSQEEIEDDPDTQQAVAAAAGRAADELAASSLSNAVYQAWYDMTDALDVESPEATTPAEFEEIAVDAGLDRADVRTLTELFRDIRYGDANATAEREQRARETLRRIEATYAESDGEQS